MDWPVISLETNDRGLLNRQLKTRFEAMLSAGFAYEVRALRQRGDWSPALPSMRCVGYRHAWEALDAADPPALGPLRERAQAATRQLVKRQITWLRSMPTGINIDIDAADLDTRLAAAVRAVITRS